MRPGWRWLSWTTGRLSTRLSCWRITTVSGGCWATWMAWWTCLGWSGRCMPGAASHYGGGLAMLASSERWQPPLRDRKLNHLVRDLLYMVANPPTMNNLVESYNDLMRNFGLKFDSGLRWRVCARRLHEYHSEGHIDTYRARFWSSRRCLKRLDDLYTLRA